jgi:hypothetical protein
MSTFENNPQQALSAESQERLNLIKTTLNQLENVSDFNLDSSEGREALKVALSLIFSQIERIEGEDVDGNGTGYEIVGLIKGRIRDTYEQLYSITYHKGATTPESAAFFSEVEEVMEMIETRGQRFIEDMDIYKKFNEEQKAA